MDYTPKETRELEAFTKFMIMLAVIFVGSCIILGITIKPKQHLHNLPYHFQKYKEAHKMKNNRTHAKTLPRQSHANTSVNPEPTTTTEKKHAEKKNRYYPDDPDFSLLILLQIKHKDMQKYEETLIPTTNAP